MADKTLIPFEDIKRKSENIAEFWSSRQLSKVLEYSEYRHFLPVIERAKVACKNSGQKIENHFEDYLYMVKLGSNTSRQISDVKLSRYACYLIMQNADPSKEIVAIGQTYFAIQTRKQELQNELVEDQKRMALRDEITAHNKHLAETASKAGVKNYGVFTNYGYRGLYAGLNTQDIHKRKRLKKSQKILDHMASEELAANLFRATQTDAKIRREQIQGEAKANQTHFEVGRKVRQTIKDLGGTMPETLPIAEKISKARSRLKKSPKQELSVSSK